MASCAIGFQAGFILGCAEVLDYVVNATSLTALFIACLAQQWPELTPFEPLLLLVSVVFTCAILKLGGKTFWRFTFVLAVLLLLWIVIYCLGAIPYLDYAANAGGLDSAFLGDFQMWFSQLPNGIWLYTGIEGLNTLCNEVHDPTASIPRGQVACMLTVFATAIAIYVVALGLPPGFEALPTVFAILNGLFDQLFNISDDMATLLTLSSIWAGIPGLVLCSSNIIASMSESKLLGIDLHERHATFETPARALVFTCSFMLILCFIMLYSPTGSAVLLAISSLLTYLVYISQCVGYIFLKRRFRTMPRSFHSPLGVPGAAFSTLVFSFCAISSVAVKDTDVECLVLASCLVLLLSLYYQCYAKSRQTISEDERKLLFFVHIANNNNARRRHTLHSLLKRWLKYVPTTVSYKSPSKARPTSAKVYIANSKKSIAKAAKDAKHNVDRRIDSLSKIQ
ncbi:unnamed protein product [Aphanomyces euteiches]